ncbi:MAG: hypothetical protein QOH35_472 [Acidobacteriaceae bacterium]|jgi:hypothetical protein|nr:hypothetical protein [Acidobacteriaceae bacterium]MEA2539106.1 hypothetical protein [Acidobacteriaceae bacterium]MEA3007362.1 hypothetical protein [Acidobacteriaceae bacterium]
MTLKVTTGLVALSAVVKSKDGQTAPMCRFTESFTACGIV